MRKLFLGVFVLFYATACQETSQKIQDELMPIARGEVGEIIMVMDSAQYLGDLGESIKLVFEEPMKGLPQDEPQFNLNKVNPKRLNNTLRGATNLLFVMTLDNKTEDSKRIRGFFSQEALKKIVADSSLFIATRKDEYARGQVVLYLFGQSESQLIKKLKDNKARLQEIFESADRERIKDRLYKTRESESEKAVKEKHNFSIDIPFGWDMAKNSEDFVWLRFLEADKEHNLFIYHEPYQSTGVFEDPELVRDKVTHTYLRDSERSEVFVTRQVREDLFPVDKVMLRFSGMYGVRMRGLWKISDNSGGGPFISYLFVHEPSQTLYYIEGYVYSPGSKKKNLIRELDAILSTFQITEK